MNLTTSVGLFYLFRQRTLAGLGNLRKFYIDANDLRTKEKSEMISGLMCKNTTKIKNKNR